MTQLLHNLKIIASLTNHYLKHIELEMKKILIILYFISKLYLI